MLEFSQLILDKMSFDENLFMKELRKLIIWSENEKTDELEVWCIQNYGEEYGDKITEAFDLSRNNNIQNFTTK